MSRSKVVLIGCGNIGTRLLQSLVTMPEEGFGQGLDLICIDPVKQGRELARTRFEEAADDTRRSNVLLATESEIGDLPAEIDLAIIATTAGPRFSIFNELLKRTRPRRVLLEKFLFTRKSCYGEVAEALERNQIDAWVHAPRSAWPGYMELSRRIEGPVTLRATGSNWALSSNAIHFVPALQRLAGINSIRFDASGLDAAPVPNKREGYLDVTGTLVGVDTLGNRLELTSFSQGRLPVLVEVLTPTQRYLVREGAQTMSVEEGTSEGPCEEGFPMLRASEMQTVFADILRRGECDLPRYADMVQPHLDMISIFNGVFFGPGHEDRDCPVT